MAKIPELKLREGDVAPAFTAEAHRAGSVSLSKFKGHHVVLFFYPKDDTPGCIKEACGFRDDYAAFQKRQVVVLGVSVDSLRSHERYATKHQLPFPLITDEAHQIVEAYGVWGEKVFMGRRYQGTHRVTFLIGPDGRIARIWPKVSPEGHAAEVLRAIQEIGQPQA